MTTTDIRYVALAAALAFIIAAVVSRLGSAVIHRTLAREPSARFGSAAEMGDALAPWADERSHLAIARLRNAGRPTSVAPPPMLRGSGLPQSVVPPALDARAAPEAAMAKTHDAAGFASIEC